VHHDADCLFVSKMHLVDRSMALLSVMQH